MSWGSCLIRLVIGGVHAPVVAIVRWGSRAGCGRRRPVTAPCACGPLKSVSFTCERGWLGVKDAVPRQRFAVPSTVQTDHLRLSAAAEPPAADPGQPEIWRADQLATPAGGRGPPGPQHIRRRRPSVDAMVMSTPARRTLAAAPSLPFTSTSYNSTARSN